MDSIHFKRFALEKLNEWKESFNRKPLLLRGARQVGKTYLLKEFAENYFVDYVYFNFDENIDLSSIFKTSKNIAAILEKLSVVATKKIDKNTLIIFDEIQLCSEALNSLKYFNENASDFYVVAAGSLLGLAIDKMGVPVGQVNIVNLYPLTFEEYLYHFDKHLYKYYIAINITSPIDDIFHNRLLDFYRMYLSIGGLPEAIKVWAYTKDPREVKKIHDELALMYESDIQKHHGDINSDRILLVYRSLVSQLAKENNKFIYGAIRSGARAREYETAIEWLVSAGFVYRIHGVSKNEYPLKAYQNLSSFKLYFLDTGLLKHLAGVTNESLILDKDFQFKGALTENFVCQQIISSYNITLAYFTFKSNYETDFLIQQNEQIIPIEIKASKNVKSNSSRVYKNTYHPQLYIRFSALNFRYDGNIINIPLYLVNRTVDIVQQLLHN